MYLVEHTWISKVIKNKDNANRTSKDNANRTSVIKTMPIVHLFDKCIDRVHRMAKKIFRKRATNYTALFAKEPLIIGLRECQSYTY